jgi:hypothetical protein
MDQGNQTPHLKCLSLLVLVAPKLEFILFISLCDLTDCTSRAPLPTTGSRTMCGRCQCPWRWARAGDFLTSPGWKEPERGGPVQGLCRTSSQGAESWPWRVRRLIIGHGEQKEGGQGGRRTASRIAVSVGRYRLYSYALEFVSWREKTPAGKKGLPELASGRRRPRVRGLAGRKPQRGKRGWPNCVSR